MSKLTFSDGVSFDLDRPIHAELREDGWYVVGNGFMMAVESQEEAWQVIKDMTGEGHLQR